MKKIIVILLLSVSLFGCTTEKLVYIKPQAYTFQKIEPPSAREIRIHPQDAELYQAYIDRFRQIIDFYNDQIDSYLSNFEPE